MYVCMCVYVYVRVCMYVCGESSGQPRTLNSDSEKLIVASRVLAVVAAAES